MLKAILAIPLTAALLLSVAAQAGEQPRSPAPEGAKLYIISPEEGETVSNPVTVRFGLQGMGVAPAGLDKASTGHHHLIIDGEGLPAFDKPMGKDVRHFGGGQTETTIELAPGEHTLQLILGNYLHIPHDPPVISEKITIFVE